MHVGEELGERNVDMNPVANVPEVGLDQTAEEVIPEKFSIPHVGENIEYRINGSETWVKAKVLSIGGKSTGKNWAHLNLQEENKHSPSG